MAEQERAKHHPFCGLFSDEALAHARAARQEMRRSVEGLLPPSFAEHRRAAHREMLLAARCVVDAALERIEARAAK